MAAAAGSGAEAAVVVAARLEGAEGEEETAATAAAADEEDGEEDGGGAGKAAGAAAAGGREAGGGGESEEDEEEEGEDVFEVEKILDVKTEGVSARVSYPGRGAREKNNPFAIAMSTTPCTAVQRERGFLSLGPDSISSAEDKSLLSCWVFLCVVKLVLTLRVLFDVKCFSADVGRVEYNGELRVFFKVCCQGPCSQTKCGKTS